MKTDKELNDKIEELCENYHGQLDDLYQVVGMIVVGRLFGWRVMRLVSTRPNWHKSAELFGDVKDWMPERGRFAHRSWGLKIADDLGKFWHIVRGTVKLDQDQRRRLYDTPE